MAFDFNPIGDPFDLTNTILSGDLTGDAVVSISGGAGSVLIPTGVAIDFNISAAVAGTDEYKVSLSEETDGLLAKIGIGDLTGDTVCTVATGTGVLVGGDASIGFAISSDTAGTGEVKIALTAETDGLLALLDVSDISHGDLSDLTNADDHSQYAYLQGRPTTQVFSGGNAVDATLRLQSNQAVPYSYDIEVGSRLIPYGKHATLTNQNIIYTSAEGGTNGNLLSVKINYTGVFAPCTVSMVGTEIRGEVYIGTMAQDFVDVCLLDAMIAKYFSFEVLNNLSMGPTGGSLFLTGGLPQVALGKQATDQWENIWTNGISSDNVGGGGINIVTVSGPLYYSAATSLIQDATVNWTTSVLTGDASLTTYTGDITLSSAVDVDITSSAGIITLDAMGDLDLNAGGSIYMDAPTGGLSISGATGIGFTSSGGTISFDAFTDVTFKAANGGAGIMLFTGGPSEYAFSNVGASPINLYTAIYDIGGQPPKTSIYTGTGQSLDMAIYLPAASPAASTTASGHPIVSDTSGQWSYLAPLAVNLVPFFNGSAALATSVNFSYDGSDLLVPGLKLTGTTSGFIKLLSPAAPTSTTYTFPSADGSSGQVLSTDASGNLSWVTRLASFSEADTLASVTARGATTTDAVIFQHANGIEIGKDAAANTAGKIKLWGASTNDFFTTITAATQTASVDYTLPVAAPSTNGLSLACTTAGVLSWEYSQKKLITTKTASATLSDAEFIGGIVHLDGTSAVVDIGLPTPSAANSGYVCKLCCINAVNQCTITNTIGGVATYAFSGINDFVNVYNNGTNYYFG